MEFIYLLAGLVIGSISAFFFLKGKFASSTIDISTFRQTEIELGNERSERSRLEERAKLLHESNELSTLELNTLRNKNNELSILLGKAGTENQGLISKLQEQKEELRQLHDRFSIEFKNLANEILEDKSKKFTEQNKQNIEGILKPLSEKITEFEKKVNENSSQTLQSNAALKEQILGLKQLNIQMSKEANNLTNALKGQVKTQGNWGEMILESILEKSGLEKGREYQVQESFQTEDGRRLQPDVIVRLPENKCLVIDSKVSLNAFEKYSNSDNDEEKEIALAEHISSVKKHIKDLSSKNYQNLEGLNTPDFVMIFIPIEPAFNLAFQNNQALYQEAIDRNIVVVSTSNLLATLRLIKTMWRQENQTRNAIEIARQSGDLYDKFVGFVEDLEKIGKSLGVADKTYQDAMKKLSTGSGNLVNRADKLKKIGAKASKSLPQHLISDESEEAGIAP